MQGKAIIYCRVSSTRQRTEGHGLESQEHRCRMYAKQNGYEVFEVFHDDFTGGGDFMKRPAMGRLIAFLDDHPEEKFTIIFDDLKRLARDIEFHWKLRKTLKQRNATPKCLNFNFEDSPEGEFVETILASAGELERKQNQRQVCEKMKARLEKGYWVFSAPLGYEYTKNSEHGKVLTFKEPDYVFVKKALEGYADGTFQSKSEVRTFLEEKLNRRLGNETIPGLLTRILNAGYIEHAEWGVERRKGHHKGIITLETFKLIQERIEGKKYSFRRKDNHPDFPLRGFVKCLQCNRYLTGSWSTGGSGKKHPYYHCLSKRCSGGIKKQLLENEFKKLLKQKTPTKGLLSLIEMSALIAWAERNYSKKAIVAKIEAEIAKVEKEKQVMAKKASKTTNDDMQIEYENQYTRAKKRLEKLRKKLNESKIIKEVGTATFKGKKLLENPYFSWENGDLKCRQSLQNLLFPEGIPYCRNKAFGTPKNAVVYSVLGNSCTKKSYWVDLIGKHWNDFVNLFDWS